MSDLPQSPNSKSSSQSKPNLSITPPSSLKSRLSSPLVYVLSLIMLCLGFWFLWQSYQLYEGQTKKEGPIIPGLYACSPDGECLLYPEFSALELCPITFKSRDCDNQCDPAENRCREQ